MPELPEVEVIGRSLAAALTGRVIVRVELFRHAMRTPLAPLATGELPGRRITGVRRRARYLIASLDDGRALLMHFGMTGVVRIEPASVPRRKHEHVFLHLDDGLVFRFECVRRFSRLELCRLAEDGWPEELAGFGPEPLSEEFTAEYLYRKSRGHHGAVKPFLMDNSVVAGIGNIYATESLFEAKISPRREAEKLSRSDCARLVVAAKQILAASIGKGGTTVSNYRHVDGTEGRFALSLMVYGKAGQSCPVCGTALNSVRLGGRSSVYCPRCQKR